MLQMQNILQTEDTKHTGQKQQTTPSSVRGAIHVNEADGQLEVSEEKCVPFQ